MGLDDLVVRIIKIIRYENFSLTSVLNDPAVLWARRNMELFPLDTTQIVGPFVEASILDRIQILDIDSTANDLNIVIIE